jgi:hypothetical protein
VSYLFQVSNYSLKQLQIDSISSAIQDPKVVFSFFYVGLAFPILKILILKVHNLSPALRAAGIGDTDEAITMKVGGLLK